MNLDISPLINTVVENKGYIALASGWLLHVYVPHLKRVYPFISTNGGILGLVRRFLLGTNPAVVNPPTVQPQPIQPTT